MTLSLDPNRLLLRGEDVCCFSGLGNKAMLCYSRYCLDLSAACAVQSDMGGNRGEGKSTDCIETPGGSGKVGSAIRGQTYQRRVGAISCSTEYDRR